MSFFRITFISFFLSALPYASFGTMMEFDDQGGRFIINSAIGPVGIGDRTEFLDATTDAGPTVTPRTRTISHVYLGYALDFHLRGRASFWRSMGPILIAGPLLILGYMWRTLQKRREIIGVLLGSICGFYYGVMLRCFSGLYGGNWKSWAEIMGSPFAFMDIRLGCLFWLVVGMLLTLRNNRWSVTMLLICMVFCYLCIFVDSIWWRSMGWFIGDGTHDLLMRYPVWCASWLLILIVGQSILWVLLVKKIRNRVPALKMAFTT
jgi:hypothetical protein